MSAPAAKAEQPKGSAPVDRSASLQSSPRALTTMSENRPVAAGQRQMQALISNSPRMQRAAAQQALIAQSPRQQAAQLRAVTPGESVLSPVKRNTTGLPDQLKAGVENISGYSLDDVQVHYNSAKPAQLQAHAYAQGSEIHLAPGQEQHLPHEAWHVVQQKQGRVKATTQLKGVGVNDDSALEREADAMGARALHPNVAQRRPIALKHGGQAGEAPLQAIIDSDAFRLQTRGSLLHPRKSVNSIDGPLDNYHAAAQANKLVALGALLTAITMYIAGKAGSPDDARVTAVKNLRAAVLDEQPLVVQLDILAQHGIVATLADIDPLHAIPDDELEQLAALGQLTSVAHVAQFHALPRAHADKLTLAALQYGGRALSLQEMSALDAVPLANIQALAAAALPQAPTWTELKRLLAIANWSAAEVIRVAESPIRGAMPTLQEMEQVSAFTPTEIQNLYRAGVESWARLANTGKIHAAPNNQDPSEEVVTAMAGNMVKEPKRNVANVLDVTRSCWNWATQGFEVPVVSEGGLANYFARRTNFPPYYGAIVNHAAAVDILAGPAADDPIRVYLNHNQAALQGIVATWEANHLMHAEQANQEAQLALMRLELSESGFDVLPQGTDSRWYICMHELQSNVGWEHWWIKTRAGDVIETFPARGEIGKYIAFHQSDVNMGDEATDFRHEVPVANLLPPQLAIIRRALVRVKARIADAIA